MIMDERKKTTHSPKKKERDGERKIEKEKGRCNNVL